MSEVLGEWKPNATAAGGGCKYQNMTEQAEYVQKRLDLLDPAKLYYMQMRAKMINEELQSTQPSEWREFAHNREEIEDLY